MKAPRSLPLANWKRRGRALDQHTQLVLDGFTRSASTFAVIAFQLAQNDHVQGVVIEGETQVFRQIDIMHFSNHDAVNVARAL